MATNFPSSFPSDNNLTASFNFAYASTLALNPGSVAYIFSFLFSGKISRDFMRAFKGPGQAKPEASISI